MAVKKNPYKKILAHLRSTSTLSKRFNFFAPIYLNSTRATDTQLLSLIEPVADDVFVGLTELAKAQDRASNEGKKVPRDRSTPWLQDEAKVQKLIEYCEKKVLA